MPATRKRKALSALQQQLDLTTAGAMPVYGDTCPDGPAALFSEPEPIVDECAGSAKEPEHAEPFGRWLLAQKDRGDWIDAIASAARQDRRFPKDGTADEVRDHLRQAGADSDALEALDDAELDWASL